MLSKAAFNALLKTLEEPPAHVVFILATTEAHKLPETIISRTQRYSFKPVEMDKVVAHLKHIAKEEKITVSDDAFELIAAHGEGSFRDSISLLDQVRNTKDKITLESVQAVLGIAPTELITTIVSALQNHDSVTVAQTLKQMHDQGYEAAQIARQLGATFRQSVLEGKTLLEHEVTMRLLGQLVQTPASPDPRVTLEIALLDAAMSGAPASPISAVPAPASTSKPHKPVVAEAKVMTEEVQAPAKPAIQVDTKKEIEEATKPVAAPAVPDKKSDEESSEELQDVGADMVLTEKAWDIILNAIKQKHNTLYSVIKMAQPHFEPGKVVLEFAFAFHQKRINDARNKQVLQEVISGVTGSEMQITCIVGEGKPAPLQPPLPPSNGEMVHNVTAPTPDTAAPATAADNDVDAISNIFGGAELLES